MPGIERANTDWRDGAADTVTWMTRPGRLTARQTGVIAAATLASLFCALTLFHSPAFAIVAAALVLTSVSDRIVPLTYSLDSRGARVRFGPVTWLEMRWSDVRCVSCTPRGLKLSAFENPATAMLESRRGIQLVFDPAMGLTIEDAVKQRRMEAGTSR